MPIPIIFFALVIVLVLAILLLVAYFGIMVAFKLLKILFGGAMLSPLPSSVKRPMREAREYAEKIKRTARQCPPGPMRDRLDQTVKPVDEWLNNLNRLEQALSKLYSQRNPARELRRTQYEIEELRRQILVASRSDTASLKALMASKKKQYAVLEELQAFQNQAELKIRKIASDLGIAHTEMLLVTARGDFNDNRFQRLDENLQDNLTGLRDILSAMDDMGYTSNAVGW
jgi:hypothetical protein